MARSRRLAVALFVGLTLIGLGVLADETKPGELIEYAPFFPDRWTAKKQSTSMTLWEGERVVLLTTRADLDKKTMAVFLARLDAGWKLYEDLVGQKPGLNKAHKGKETIAVVPDPSFTCGMGCGNIGTTGVEIGGFYKSHHFDGLGDYEGVKKNPARFAPYYFYEMGRNYFLFGDRHSAFTTGFAVFMSHVCMDTLKCEDPDKAARDTIDKAEAIYASSNLTFEEAFFGSKDRADKAGRADANALYASVMLKLREDHGGNEWVKRFYAYIQQCPQFPTNIEENRVGQALFWVIAASLAARQDLSAVFEKRWRFPLKPEVWQSLKTVDWKKDGLTATAVFDALPVEHLPTAVVARHPEFLTADRRKANLIVGGTFEDGASGRWSARSWRNAPDAVRATDAAANEGKRSVAIRSTEGDDASYVQKVKLTPDTRYLLSGWVKTKGVTVVQEGGTGANLSLAGGFEVSESVVGDTDWRYVVLLFDSGKRTEVEVCARLGFYGSVAKGEAWFDDLVLIDLGKAAQPQ